MARLQTNLVLDGQQVTLSVDSGEQSETEFLDNFKEILGHALTNGYSKPTAPAAAPASGSAAGANDIIWKPVSEIVCGIAPPDKDGKARGFIEFFGDDIKQPRNDYFTVKSMWTPDKLVELMSDVGNFTEQHFQQPGTYKLRAEVGYRLSSKLNSAGNPYKNVAAVRKIEGAPAAQVEAVQEQPPLPDPTEDIPF
jgi:hypothetical protein